MTKFRKNIAAIALSAVVALSGAAGAIGLHVASAEAADSEIDPIAKYEFKDSTNFGKDSMGNYDMSYRNQWQAGGTGPLWDKGTLIEGGGVSFSGEFCVSQDQDNNIFQDVTAFTLAFEIKTSASVEWQHYIGVGGNAENYLAIVGRGGSAGSDEAKQAILNAAGTNAGLYWDGAWVSNASSWGDAENEFQSVIISAQPGGQLNVYVNGVAVTVDGKIPATLAADWSPYDADVPFSIGARYNGAADCPSTGALKNVVFYDFAVDEYCANAYYTNGKITSTDLLHTQELTPVAKWEFEDADNIGKDSMGNYDLGPVAIEGGDLSNPYGMGTIENGMLYLSGSDMLACPALNDVGDNLNNGFTLNFQYRQDGLTDGDWASPISFGFNDWNSTTICHFVIAGNSKELRIGAHGGVAANEEDGNVYWGPVILTDGTDAMHNVTLSVRPGEKFNVYVDGALAYSADCPAGWNLSNSNMAFAIGGSCVWGNGYSLFKGWIDNVSIYNFALSLEQSNAFWEKGKIVVSDMNGEIITSIADTPVFENGTITSGNLTDRLTDTQAVRRVNSATVDALFANGNSVALNVTWQRLEQDGDKWYIVGSVDTGDIGYATLLTGAQTVKQEVSVEKAARAVNVANATNGTVTADKEEAYLGDTVTITLTPNEGYTGDTVTVNGVMLTANANGTYSYVVEGIDDIEISATFKEASTNSGDNGTQNGTNGGTDNGNVDNGNEGGSNTLAITLGIIGGVVVIAAVVVAVVLVRKKKTEK